MFTVGRLETITWVLIYGGFLILVWGLFVGPPNAELGWAMVAFGCIAAAVGGFLVYLRSKTES